MSEQVLYERFEAPDSPDTFIDAVVGSEFDTLTDDDWRQLAAGETAAAYHEALAVHHEAETKPIDLFADLLGRTPEQSPADRSVEKRISFDGPGVVVRMSE